MEFLKVIALGLLVLLPCGAKSHPTVAGQQPADQSRAQSQTDTPANFNPESLSPQLIELYIDINEDVDLRHIWRLLRIKTLLPYRCPECIAETFDIESTNQAEGVALRISWASGEHYQYLVFRKANSASTRERWIFIGNIDSRGQRFAAPVHRIESGENRTWFVLRELWGQQSRAEAYGEVWYEIREKDLKQVLSYPVAGEHKPCQKGLGHSYRSVLARHSSLSGVYTVPIQFLIAYNISDCERGRISPALFAREQKALYVWNPSQERFVLDITQSDITEKEIESVYSLDGPGDEEFVQYNFDRLSDIAKGGNVDQKDWLHHFLNNLQNGPRKTALLKALQQ